MALVHIELGDSERALAIAGALEGGDRLSRAHRLLIEGVVSLDAGRHYDAVERFSRGIAIADLWLLRYWRGIAYFESGAFVEALDEFKKSEDRRGEASAAFLDGKPTWHLTALLPYWSGRAQSELGMQTDAEQQLRAFMDYRMAGPEAADARTRLP